MKLLYYYYGLEKEDTRHWIREGFSKPDAIVSLLAFATMMMGFAILLFVLP